MRPRKNRRSSRRSRELGQLGNPTGVLSPRVQKVGPEHFGIVAVDCAKARSKWMVTDFYGRTLVPPTVVEHNRAAFDEAIAVLRQTIARYGLKDLVVVVERTGRYHLPVLRAFASAGFETRVVHPSISRHFREAAAYDNKTDDTDLWGISRAAINGFGFQDPPWDVVYGPLQFWARCRHDLVRKTSLLRCQILEHLEAYLPGYSRLFENVFRAKIALLIASQYPTPEAIVQAGLPGLTQLARLGRVQVFTRTLVRILGWPRTPQPPTATHLCTSNACATSTTIGSPSRNRFDPSSKSSLATWCRRPMSVCWHLPASTSCWPASSPAKPGRLCTTPRQGSSPVVPACTPGVIRAIKSIMHRALWPAAAIADSAVCCS